MTLPLFRGAWLLAGVSLATAYLLAPYVQAGNLEDAQHVVTGTLVKLDLVEAKGTFNTDLGDAILFDIPKPELFEHLSVGSRITIEMNESGGADKVISAAMADILASQPAFQPDGR
jgi:hypothetical protein